MALTPMEMGYKLVADRHAQFVKDNPKGVVRTRIEAHQIHMDGTGYVIVRCEVWKDRANADAGQMADGNGHAGIPIPGTTNFTRNSEVENAETSALGRALAMIGYHPKDTMASDDEIAMKKEAAPSRRAKTVAAEDTIPTEADEGMRKQRAMLMNWGKKVLGSREEFLAWLKDEFSIVSGKDIKPEQVADIKKMLAITGAAKGEDAPEGVEYDA